MKRKSLIATPYLVAMREPAIAAADYAGPSWDCWWVVHAALDAVPPPAERVPHWRDIWAAIAGGRPWPTVRPREPWVFGSRRIAKSREFARRGAWACLTFDPSHLSPGERAVFAFTAPDRAQAALAFEYAVAFVERSPMLAAMIESRTKSELLFTNRTAMRVMTASFRTQRGVTLIGAHNDEAAFMYDGEASANPIGELLAAQRPATSTIATAQLSGATTPRARSGEVYQIFARGFGVADDRALVLRIPWHLGNPTLDPAIIEAEVERDESVARAEYFAEFRADLETFLPREAVMACVVPHRSDLPPTTGARVQWFCDPAGGSGGDSFTLAGAMRSPDNTVVIVRVAERKPPFSPDETTLQFADVIRQYGGHSVTGDRYAGEWPRERFAKHGITYRLSTRTKSEIYGAAMPLITAGLPRIALPDHPRLIAQLCALERHVARGGRESIDHPPRGHDDIANAVLGAALLVSDTFRIRHGGGALPTNLVGGPAWDAVQRERRLLRRRSQLPLYAAGWGCATATHPRGLVEGFDKAEVLARATAWTCPRCGGPNAMDGAVTTGAPLDQPDDTYRVPQGV